MYSKANGLKGIIDINIFVLPQTTKGKLGLEHIRRIQTSCSNPDFIRTLSVPIRTCSGRHRKGSGMGQERDGSPDAWIGQAW